MTPQEVIKNLSGMKQMECFTCIHPQQVGWCENNCHKDDIYDTAINALEKQIPKKPINEYDNYAGGILHHCPNCNAIVQKHGMFGELFINPMHCMCCGQAIDWSDTK